MYTRRGRAPGLHSPTPTPHHYAYSAVLHTQGERKRERREEQHIADIRTTQDRCTEAPGYTRGLSLRSLLQLSACLSLSTDECTDGHIHIHQHNTSVFDRPVQSVSTPVSSILLPRCCPVLPPPPLKQTVFNSLLLLLLHVPNNDCSRIGKRKKKTSRCLYLHTVALSWMYTEKKIDVYTCADDLSSLYGPG